MKQRIISAIIGLSLLGIVLFLYRTLILNIAVAAGIAVSIYEILHTIGIFPQQKGVFVACELFGIAFPFLNMPEFCDVRVPAFLLFAGALFAILLKRHHQLNIEKLAFAALATMLISFSMSVLVYFRDYFADAAMYYIILLFIIAWICDAGAYFCGRAFGKHKLAPNISPNKTVEGAVCGVLVNFIAVIIATAVFQIYIFPISYVDYAMLAAVTLIGSLVAVTGDLCASAIKRQYGIKDFGNLLPGHGGAVDRFDSWMLTAIVFYVFVSYVPLMYV